MIRQQDANLIGFLQKQSLFSSSSHRRASRSRSHRSKLLASQRNQDYLQQQSRFGLNPLNSRSGSKQRQNSPRGQFNSSRVIESSRVQQQQQQQRIDRRNWLSTPNHKQNDYSNYVYGNRTNDRQQSRDRGIYYTSYTPTTPNKQPRPSMLNTAPSYTSKPSSFQTAHIQSIQCLTSISNKLFLAIADLDHKLAHFRQQTKTWIAQQLIKAQQSIIDMVEQYFQQQQQTLVQAYVEQVEAQHAQIVIKNKTILQQEYQRVEELQTHLRGDKWRQTAGEILSAELEKKVSSAVKQASRVDLGTWRPKSFVRDHLRIIQIQVKQLLKVNTFPS